jgi:hypothetical protein
MSSTAAATAVKELAPAFAGRLIQPIDPLFNEVRMVER